MTCALRISAGIKANRLLVVIIATLGCNLLPLSASAQGIASSSFVNVRDFGATGDGVTDDTVSIQAALDAVSPGQAVYFPAGTYMLGTPTAIVDYLPTGDPIFSALILRRDHVELVGDGQRASVLMLMPHTKMRAFTGASHYVSWHDLGVDGNKGQRDGSRPYPYADVVDAMVLFNAASSDISVTRCDIGDGLEDALGFWLVPNVSVTNCRLHGNSVSSTVAGGGIAFAGVVNAIASSNLIDGNGFGISAGYSSHNVTMADNVVRGNLASGLVIGGFDVGDGDNSGYSITENDISGNGILGYAAITVASASNGVIADNSVTNNFFGILIYDVSPYPASTGWELRNNLCSDTRPLKKRTQRKGIAISAHTQATLAGNTCQNNGASVTDQVTVDSTATVNSDWQTVNTVKYRR